MCELCGNEEDCTLISFKMRPSDKDWQERMKKIHGVGHPPWEEWFCSEHAAVAKKYSDLPIDVALKKIRDELNK